MKKIIVLLCVVLIGRTQAGSQTPDTTKHKVNKVRFHSILSVGVLKGESKNPELQFQTINGVAFKNWFLSAGAAIDYYDQRSVPVFADLRKNFSIVRNSFFVYADLGVNIPWKMKGEQTWYNYDYENGAYYDFGLGYSINAINKQQLLISAGYTLKSYTRQWSYSYTHNGVLRWEYGHKEEHELRRLVLKFGWKF